jgi:uncharacterized protein with GYD domain
MGRNRFRADDTNCRSKRRKTAGAISALAWTVKELFWTQGRHDIVTVIEAPDEFSATALNLSLSALGNIRTETLRAFSAADMMKIIAKML